MEVPQPVQKLLAEFQYLFDVPHSLPPRRAIDHKITPIPGAQPVNIRPYWYSPQQKSEIENQVNEMLQSGVIQMSSSPFASSVLLVKKKDGSWHFCVDYRALNALIVKNKHPPSCGGEIIRWIMWGSMVHQAWLVVGIPLDLNSRGWWTQNNIQNPSWLVWFLVMPFGLTNAPATFQHIMNTIFHDLLHKCVLVFMDDILVYSSTLQHHVQHLTLVFQTLAQHQFLIKYSKCMFAQQSLEYLGHIMTAKGIATDLAKIEAISKWPVPTNLRQLRGFLGLAAIIDDS
jgi:hypothetical protein